MLNELAFSRIVNQSVSRRASTINLAAFASGCEHLPASCVTSFANQHNRGARMDSFEQQIFLDDRHQSYRGLHSDDWCIRFDDLVAGSPTLQHLGYDLMLHWRGAAYTAEFPASLIDHFASFATGFMREPPTPNADILKLATALIARCSRDVPEISADPSVQSKLRNVFVEMAAQFAEFGETKFEFPRDRVWKRYLQEDVFQITIWSSLRICYVAIFNAYDNFIAQCLQLAAGDPKVRTADRDFNKRFASIFGESMPQQCWHTNDMHIIRQTRHALSHAGGRETERLGKLAHQIRVEGGKLQITPADVYDEFSTLKVNAFELASHVRDWPCFKAKPTRS